MKKIILIHFFLFTTFCGFGQRDNFVVVSTGVFWALDDTKSPNLRHKNRLSWQSKLSYVYSVTDEINVSAGVGYSSWKLGYEKDFFWGSGMSVGDEQYNLDELLLPLSMSWQPGVLFLKAGLTPRFLNKMEQRHKFFRSSSNWIYRDERDNYQSINLSAHLAVGMQFRLGSNWRLAVDSELWQCLFADTQYSLFGVFKDKKVYRKGLGANLSVRYIIKVKNTLRTLG